MRTEVKIQYIKLHVLPVSATQCPFDTFFPRPHDHLVRQSQALADRFLLLCSYNATLIMPVDSPYPRINVPNVGIWDHFFERQSRDFGDDKGWHVSEKTSDGCSY